MFIDTPEAIDRPSNNAILHLVSSEPSTNRTRNAHAALSQHGYQLFPGLTRLFDVRFYLRTSKNILTRCRITISNARISLSFFYVGVCIICEVGIGSLTKKKYCCINHLILCIIFTKIRIFRYFFNCRLVYETFWSHCV